MPDEPPRSRAARIAAETALVRLVHHYGSRPEFVLMGGLMPEYLCADSGFRHAGTTDIDVQVDLEIACGTVNVQKLEQALLNAEFEPDTEQVWRWTSDALGVPAVVKFELLAPLEPSTCAERASRPGMWRLGASRRAWETSNARWRSTSPGWRGF